MSDWDAGSVRAVKIMVQTVGLVGGLLLGHKLLTIRADWFEPGFRPPQYEYWTILALRPLVDVVLTTLARGSAWHASRGFRSLSLQRGKGRRSSRFAHLDGLSWTCLS